jgi:hypothetical protein
MPDTTALPEVEDLLDETDAIAVELNGESAGTDDWDVYVSTGCPGTSNHGSYWSTVDISVLRELATHEHFTIYDRSTREVWTAPAGVGDATQLCRNQNRS